jgi:hypothetical protein
MKQHAQLWEKPSGLIKHIESIAVKARDCKFSPEFFNEVMNDADEISLYLQCNEIQAIFFSIIFNLNFRSASVSLDDIADYLDCSPVTVVAYMDDLDTLTSLKILRKFSDSDGRISRYSFSLDKHKYYVNSEVLEYLSLQKVFTAPKAVNLDMYELLEEANKFLELRDNNMLTFDEMTIEIDNLLEDNRSLEFVKQLRRQRIMSGSDMIIMLYLCHGFIEDEMELDLGRILRVLIPEMKKRLNFKRMLLHGRSDLVLKNLVSFEEGGYMSDRSLKLTDRAIELFFGEDRLLFQKKGISKRMALLLAEEIQEKKLFFSKEEEQKLEFLGQALSLEYYQGLCDRMKENGLPQAFTILMYGTPGTGKTESVFQLARRTGRDIKQVVISETKSKWFGQSEKLIKEVFDEYRQMVENMKVTPILLFNEADAIFSRRRELGNHTVDQTENAIQNIILQEMENMKGILIATTNLTENLDKAFERRFLQKIRFSNPDVDTRERIWMDKISILLISEVECLARKFQLSGGQIENVARKYQMKLILQGIAPGLEEIEGFCREEFLQQLDLGKIGFVK